MSGHDVSVRPHVTYGVHTYHKSFGANELAQHLPLQKANELAFYIHSGMGEHAGSLTSMRVRRNAIPIAEVPENHAGVLIRLLERAKGSRLVITLEVESTSEDGQESGQQLVIETIEPRVQKSIAILGRDESLYVETAPEKHTSAQTIRSARTIRSSVGDIRSAIRDVLLEEQSKIHLPETWEDLSRETSKRGLEAFMALQTATRNIRRDHEIEALVSAIAKRTGKAQSELRVTFEKAQARVAKITMPLIANLRTGAMADEIIDTVQLQLRQVGRDLDFSDVVEQVIKATRRREESVRSFVQQAFAAEGVSTLKSDDAPVREVDMTGASAGALEIKPGVVWSVDDPLAVGSPSPDMFNTTLSTDDPLAVGSPHPDMFSKVGDGSERLENATQEFFALNVGFYGMTAEAAAQQMSLPLPTADDLRRMPAVIARIDYFKRCHAKADASA